MSNKKLSKMVVSLERGGWWLNIVLPGGLRATISLGHHHGPIVTKVLRAVDKRSFSEKGDEA